MSEDSPELDMMEMEPSELPQAKRSPNSWGAKFTEFTIKHRDNEHHYSITSLRISLKNQLILYKERPL